MSQLKVYNDPLDWLSDYLEAVGKTWQTNGITKPHFNHLLPDQHGRLCNPDELKIDGGVTRHEPKKFPLMLA